MNELCQRYQEAYEDPSLPEELIRHGEHCPDCREFVRRQASLQTVLPQWQTPDFSRDFSLQVMARLAESNYSRRGIVDILRELLQFRLSIPLPVGAIMTLLLILSLPLNVYFWMQEKPAVSMQQFQIAKHHPDATFTNHPAESPTLTTIPMGKSRLPDISSLYLFPRNLYGAGAFLLVPLADSGLILKEQEDGNIEPNKGI